MNQEVKFAIEAWVTVQQDRGTRNWVLDYTPAMPGDLVSQEERLAEARVCAVDEALGPIAVGRLGISTGEPFHKQILYHVYELGPDFARYRRADLPVPLQRTLQALAQQVWPTLSDRIERNLQEIQAKWSFPQAV